ncbi:hypothetical protein SVAN01_04922 [Stagonosporopsis vannaccii]|nr:hypothetical protein SVAN01_04922 [Stagonosporopsis vannaccii]
MPASTKAVAQEPKPKNAGCLPVVIATGISVWIWTMTLLLNTELQLVLRSQSLILSFIKIGAMLGLNIIFLFSCHYLYNPDLVSETAEAHTQGQVQVLEAALARSQDTNQERMAIILDHEVAIGNVRATAARSAREKDAIIREQATTIADLKATAAKKNARFVEFTREMAEN